MKPNLEKLFTYLRGFRHLPDGLTGELEKGKIVKHETFTGKYVLADIHKLPTRICFLEEGFATAYRMEGNELTVSWFKSANSGIIPENFFIRKSSGERIVLSPGSAIVYASFEDIQYLFHKYPETEEFIRLIQDKHLRENEEEKMLLRMLSGKEKYLHLMHSRSEVIHRASLKDIASYLGIRPRQLYNIRKTIKNS